MTSNPYIKVCVLLGKRQGNPLMTQPGGNKASQRPLYTSHERIVHTNGRTPTNGNPLMKTICTSNKVILFLSWQSHLQGSGVTAYLENIFVSWQETLHLSRPKGKPGYWVPSISDGHLQHYLDIEPAAL